MPSHEQDERRPAMRTTVSELTAILASAATLDEASRFFWWAWWCPSRRRSSTFSPWRLREPVGGRGHNAAITCLARRRGKHHPGQAQHPSASPAARAEPSWPSMDMRVAIAASVANPRPHARRRSRQPNSGRSATSGKNLGSATPTNPSSSPSVDSSDSTARKPNPWSAQSLATVSRKPPPASAPTVEEPGHLRVGVDRASALRQPPASGAAAICQ